MRDRIDYKYYKVYHYSAFFESDSVDLFLLSCGANKIYFSLVLQKNTNLVYVRKPSGMLIILSLRDTHNIIVKKHRTKSI